MMPNKFDEYYVDKKILLKKIEDIEHYLSQLKEDLEEKDQDIINKKYNTLSLCDYLNKIKDLSEVIS
jgi:hypothetical protein